jgi:predicted amidohydrolase YtcJ
MTVSADLVVTNARVLTMDDAHPRAEAVALHAGRILAVGTSADVMALAGPGTRVIDGRGRSLLPGFVESHMHLGQGGAQLSHLHLSGVTGIEAMARAFRAYAARHPDRPLLMAQGAHYSMLDHPVSRHDLDAIIADRPIAMTAHDLHTVWANTAALRAAGLLQGAEMPAGHEVVMGADGMATGELREFEAFSPIIALGGDMRLNLGITTGEEPRPEPTAEERAYDKAAFRAGMEFCAAQGITSIVNMDGNYYTLELLREIEAEGGLVARVRVPFHFKPHMAVQALTRAEMMNRDFDDEWLSSGFVKLFMDGVTDTRTAYMLDDYPGMPGYRSEPLFSAERFEELATEIDRRGLQIAVHAIGDGAVRLAIDGLEAASRVNGRSDSRHRIEHIEVIDPADVPRIGALGIVASLQPPHPPGAMDFGLQPTMDTLGRARWPNAYLWHTLVENGAELAFASDWPVSDVAVLRGIQAALTRVPYEGCRDERVGLMATLQAYTAGGAWAALREHVTGRIVPGLAGDLVLLGGDIEETAPERIGQMGIALTVCGGRITHEAGAD